MEFGANLFCFSCIIFPAREKILLDAALLAGIEWTCNANLDKWG